MSERQYYVYKFNSSYLEENNYDIKVSYIKAKHNMQIVALADSQMLRTIRDITGKQINTEKINRLLNKRDEIRKMPPCHDNAVVIKEINKMINQMLFVPEYLSLIIDNVKHYKKIIRNGIMVNGKKYVRFSCSASQARVNTVIMVTEEISDKLYEKLNNNRKDIKLNPSKFNAYFGLNSSATKVVSYPRCCVVKDCIRVRDTLVNWVDRQEGELQDDIITQKIVPFEFNYFDGMGLISPKQAEVWAHDLELDYVPAQFCIRNAFVKGMVCVFDFHDFCEKKNGGRTIVQNLYGQEVDLKDVDLILTESQFKMWNCYENFEQYEQCCKQNNLQWGISQMAPKQPKDILKLNYQSIQTLKLNHEQIDELCKYTTDMFADVCTDDVQKTILYQLGENITDRYIADFMDNSDNYWLKCLILDNSLIHDKYMQQKIYENVQGKLKNACLGEIYVDGNYQTMVSDPYAFMEHVCGMEPMGLLGDKEHYSRYWNDRLVKHADAMRSPLTYLSEHNILNFKVNEETEYWYKHINTGIIYNVHGDDVIRHAD